MMDHRNNEQDAGQAEVSAQGFEGNIVAWKENMLMWFMYINWSSSDAFDRVMYHISH